LELVMVTRDDLNNKLTTILILNLNRFIDDRINIGLNEYFTNYWMADLPC